MPVWTASGPAGSAPARRTSSGRGERSSAASLRRRSRSRPWGCGSECSTRRSPSGPSAHRSARSRRFPPTRPTAGPSPRSGVDPVARDRFWELLVDLSPADWDAPTIEGWTVKGLVTHLVAVEEYFGRQLGLWPLEIDDALEADHLGMTREFVAAWSERTAAQVLARWQELTGAITAHLAGLDRAAGRQPFHFHFLDTSLSTVLITRVFEVWTHDEDIRRATGRAACAPDAARLRRMSRIAVPSIPLGLAMAGAPAPGRTARIVLTGHGGGTWDQALGWGETAGVPDATVVLDVVDYCRLAARRLKPVEIAVSVEGDEDLARQILAGAGVFSA